MPRKNHTKVPQKAIDKAVARYLGGESVIALAKEYKISRAMFYLWAKKYKRNVLEQAARKDIVSPPADKRALSTQIQLLRLENARLGNKVVALMLKLGEI